MNYQEKYQQARKAGYTDQEIMEHLAAKDQSFGDKFRKAQEAGYSPEEIIGYFNSASPKKQEQESPVRKYGRDIAIEGAKGFGIGSVGTYGDILNLLGIQGSEIGQGDEARYRGQAEIAEKASQDKGISPSEARELSAYEEGSFRLPTSHGLEQYAEEPKTAAGRYARRIGKIGGGTASLGGGSIRSVIAAGAAGQTAEELGLPPWVQAAFEIIAGAKAAPKTKTPITSSSKEVESVIKDLRKAGYAEKDITLAKNALEERNILKKYATLTPKAENAIQQGVKNSEELFKQQIKKGLPGYVEGGLPYLDRQASNVYQSMEQLASNVPIKNTTPVKKAIEDSIAYLEKFPLLDEQKKFIDFLKDGLSKVDKAESADFFTGFYRNLGKAGNWGDPKQKEHLLGLVKEGIKQTFAESGPEAAKFGKYFEKTNEAWKHWLNTRDLMETIEKATTTEGMNFKKLASILDNPKNHELAKKVLGQEQLDNIKTITKGADAIESLLKQIPRSDQTSNLIKTLEGIRAFLTGSWKTLGGLLTIEAAKSLSTKMLLDPKKQNIMKKLINAALNNTPQQAALLAQELAEDISFKPEKKKSSSNNF